MEGYLNFKKQDIFNRISYFLPKSTEVNIDINDPIIKHHNHDKDIIFRRIFPGKNPKNIITLGEKSPESTVLKISLKYKDLDMSFHADDEKLLITIDGITKTARWNDFCFYMFESEYGSVENSISASEFLSITLDICKDFNYIGNYLYCYYIRDISVLEEKYVFDDLHNNTTDKFGFSLDSPDGDFEEFSIHPDTFEALLDSIPGDNHPVFYYEKSEKEFFDRGIEFLKKVRYPYDYRKTVRDVLTVDTCFSDNKDLERLFAKMLCLLDTPFHLFKNKPH